MIHREKGKQIQSWHAQHLHSMNITQNSTQYMSSMVTYTHMLHITTTNKFFDLHNDDDDVFKRFPIQIHGVVRIYTLRYQ